jgi:hypothetical protein
MTALQILYSSKLTGSLKATNIKTSRHVNRARGYEFQMPVPIASKILPDGSISLNALPRLNGGEDMWDQTVS